MNAVTARASRPRVPVAASPSLRIAMVLESLALGGCPINALDLARSLRERGHEVLVFAIDEPANTSFVPYAERAGFTVGLLPRRATMAERARQIRHLAVENSVSVVHAFAPFLGPPTSIALATSSRRAAVVTNWEMSNAPGMAPHTPLVVGTRSLQHALLARHRSDVWLMEPMVDLLTDRPDAEARHAFRAALSVSDREVLVALVGRVDRAMKREGILHALGAVGALDDPALRLVVVGDGNALAEVRSRAEQVNARLGREAVLLTGSLPDPHPAYAGADITLAMGGSALRALAHATPVIVLGEHGFARTFGPDSVDYFSDAGFFGREAVGDPVGHLAGLIRQLGSPARREALGSFGRAQAEERFGLAAAAEAQERIYLAALAGSPRVRVRLADAAYLLTRNAAGRTRRRLAAALARRPTEVTP